MWDPVFVLTPSLVPHWEGCSILWILSTYVHKNDDIAEVLCELASIACIRNDVARLEDTRKRFSLTALEVIAIRRM